MCKEINTQGIEFNTSHQLKRNTHTLTDSDYKERSGLKLVCQLSGVVQGSSGEGRQAYMPCCHLERE